MKPVKSDLFSKRAIDHKSMRYGSVISPIGKNPGLITVIMVALLLGLLIALSNYDFDQKIRLSGQALLSIKPVKIHLSEGGYVQQVLVNDGDIIKPGDSLLTIKKDAETDVTCTAKQKSFVPTPEVDVEIPNTPNRPGEHCQIDIPFNGIIEKLNTGIGDIVQDGDLFALLVPENQALKFEFNLPVELVDRFSIDQTLMVLWNDQDQKQKTLATKVNYISSIPITGNFVNGLNSHYKMKLIPSEQVDMNIPVGTSVSIDYVFKQKSLTDLILKTSTK